MPLKQSGSKAAFTHNLKAEMKAGKPQKQSLAIAYSVKRKNKMAMGGSCYADGGPVMTESGYQDAAKPNTRPSMADHEMLEYKTSRSAPGASMPGRQGMTSSGYQSKLKQDTRPDLADHEMDNLDLSHESSAPDYNDDAMAEDERRLNQHGEDEAGPLGRMMADGGQITDNYQDDSHMRDMVGRIIQRRQMNYSEGGKVANETDPEDFDFTTPNEFDDLALRDDLESAYTGANSGDERGDAQEDADRRDPVMRIMLKRRKQTNPKPA